MVYLYYISRVSDQNGVSLLYIEGFWPEWCISTIYRGFPTKMGYLYYISRVSNKNGVSLLYIEVSNQNGVSLLYIKDFQPEWCISTIYWGFPTRIVYLYYISRVSNQNCVSLLYIMLEIHHSGREPPNYHAWVTHSGREPSIFSPTALKQNLLLGVMTMHASQIYANTTKKRQWQMLHRQRCCRL